MSLMEIALIVSILVALYNYQQIKMILKEKGYPVEMLTGWVADYRHFKELIAKERDEKAQLNYRRIFNGLNFSLMGVALFAFLLLRKVM